MTESRICIPTGELRRVFEILLTHVARGSEDELAIGKDYFWSVPSPAMYEVHTEPNALTIGRVSESWGNLEAMLQDESKLIGYGLVWLADVLRALGDHAVG